MPSIYNSQIAPIYATAALILIAGWLLARNEFVAWPETWRERLHYVGLVIKWLRLALCFQFIRCRNKCLAHFLFFIVALIQRRRSFCQRVLNLLEFFGFDAHRWIVNRCQAVLSRCENGGPK